MRSDGVPGRVNLLQDFRVVSRVLADREENTGRAFIHQCLEDGGCIERPWAVVECQHHFLVAQEIELFEMLEAKSGATGRVDLDGACDAERGRIIASGSCRLRRDEGLGRQSGYCRVGKNGSDRGNGDRGGSATWRGTRCWACAQSWNLQPYCANGTDGDCAR